MISANDLSEDQQKKVHAWVAEGVSLGEIQNRLSEDFGLKATYMEMHLLMIDLKVELPDEEEDDEEEEEIETLEPTETDASAPPPQAPPSAEAPESQDGSQPAPDMPGIPEDLPKVVVTFSDVARPGTMMGGSASFAMEDGSTEKAEWYMDQMGRLGLNPQNPDFKPTEPQAMSFQMELQRVARERGF